MNRLSGPQGLERWWVAGAGLIWIGVLAGRHWGTAAVGACAIAWLGVRRRWGIVGVGALVLALGAGVGWMATVRADLASPTPGVGGEMEVLVDVVTDARSTRFGTWVLVRPVGLVSEGVLVPWRGPVGLLALDAEPRRVVGERLRVEGLVVARGGAAAGDTYAWRMRPTEVEMVGGGQPWLVRLADGVRSRIAGSLRGAGDRSTAALVSGFLIGDVRDLDRVDREAMRGAGLSHFVAVSGSNVAMFLVVWWVVLAPISGSPMLRATFGIVGLALFGLITRWEPSVVRASAMAGLVLIGRAGGIPITAWTAVGVGTGLVLVVEPSFATDVGFQLSVAATAGVLAGARLLDGLGPRWLTLPLGVTLAAQVAVAPILLTVFGAMPVWSPLANLLAAPLVSASTALGGIGALGVPAATSLAVWLADVVLRIAHAVAGLPTVGWPGFLTGLAAVGLAGRVPRLRAPVALVAVVVLVSGMIPASTIEGPAIVALDVGQGDAIVLIGHEGGVVLVDGGPDPVEILQALARHGIARIDLAIATHPDEDHIGGIVEVVRRLAVGEVWRPELRGGHPRIDDLDGAAAGRGIAVRAPNVGDAVDVGGVRLDVLGPLRRYAAVNDESIVLVATVGELSIYLTADTEATAQRELGMPSVDVLKVPHHGSLTTDLVWLATTDAEVAVISVGDNDFGHPRGEVLAVLDQIGIEVRRTDLEGDVVLRG